MYFRPQVYTVKEFIILYFASITDTFN